MWNNNPNNMFNNSEKKNFIFDRQLLAKERRTRLEKEKNEVL